MLGIDASARTTFRNSLKKLLRFSFVSFFAELVRIDFFFSSLGFDLSFIFGFFLFLCFSFLVLMSGMKNY